MSINSGLDAGMGLPKVVIVLRLSKVVIILWLTFSRGGLQDLVVNFIRNHIALRAEPQHVKFGHLSCLPAC